MAELKVKVGDRAPSFSGSDDRGSQVELAGFLNKRHVVLYFYPKDNTPGCTLEAKGFNLVLPEFERRNTVVLGVSTDDVASHGKFRDSCALQFRLIADTKKEITRAYGALGGLSGLLGFANRVTVLIDRQGLVRATWNKVDPQGHPQEVLAEIDRLGLR
ncbi:MAG: peroxiredoxin [Acidobacteria bacterium]|nr:peroxiredoxin [Acidobacteriota bacterium]